MGPHLPRLQMFRVYCGEVHSWVLTFLYRNLRVNIWFIVDPAWLLGVRNSSQALMLNSRVWLMLIFFAFRVMETYGTMR